MECLTRSQREGVTELGTLPNEVAPWRIGLLLFSGFALPETSTVLEMYQAANTLGILERKGGGRSSYEVALLSLAGGRIDSSSGVFVWTESIENRRYVNGFHMLFVAGGAGSRHALRDEWLIRWLQREASRSEAVVSIGGGRLLLQAAGVACSTGTYGVRLTEDEAGSLRSDSGLIGAVAESARRTLALIERDFGVDFASEAVRRISAKEAGDVAH